jgi:TolA-binding protein
MTEPRSKLDRAVGAMRDEVWDELQHRRVAKRLDEAFEAQQQRSRWWLVGVGGAVAAAAVVALLLFRPAWTRSAGSQAARGGQAETARTVLSDGSMVDVNRGGQIHVVSDRAEETRIELVSGRAEFEVQKRPNRPFVTTVRGVEVRVVGTHFWTELDESRSPAVVRVVVSRGVVEVVDRQGEHVARLNAGDRIEVSLGAGAGAHADGVATPDDSASAGSAQPAPSAARAVTPPPDASKLFERARDARRAGDVQGAISAYAALLKQFPSDSRVGVVALELGRLQMDSQHAYGAAAEAFRRALSSAPNEGIREDALARLVEALDAMGDNAACLTEQRRYQARYPSGVHAASVSARCSKP